MSDTVESVVAPAGIGNLQPQPFVAGGSDPNAIIPIADFIKYVEAFEQEYPGFSPQQTVTYIRQWYYSGPKFQALIADAPIVSAPPPKWIDKTRYLDAISHIRANADENGIRDNPSPYIVGPSAEQIDVGHALLGLDALLHPRAERPYKSFGIPNIDVAAWVADLAVAVQWAVHHEKDGTPDPSAPKKAVSLVPPYFNKYYDMSATTQDLLGDADAFGLYDQWFAPSTKGKSLSQNLRAYYLGGASTLPTVKRRWQIFCSFQDPLDLKEMFPFTQTGTSILFVASKTLARWGARIDRLTDLIIAGASSAVSTPVPATYFHSGGALNKFMDWLALQLENELRTP